MGSDFSMANQYQAREAESAPDTVRPVYPRIYNAQVTIYTDPAANADFEAKITGTAATISRMLAAIGDAFEEEVQR